MSGNNPIDILTSLSADTGDELDAKTDPSSDASSGVDQDAAKPTSDGDGSGELLAGKYKTPEEVVEAYKAAEQKMHDEIQLRVQLEREVQELRNAQYAQPEPQPSQVLGNPQTMDDLISMAYERPDQAVQFAAYNAPHAMPKVIATVREYDPERAEELNMWHQQVLLEQRIQEIQAPIANMQAQAVAQQAHSTVASLPGYDLLKDDMAQFMKENPQLFASGDVGSVSKALRIAYDVAFARNQDKLKAGEQKLQQQATSGQIEAASVESRGSSVPNSGSTDDEDPAAQMRNAIFAMSKKRSF